MVHPFFRGAVESVENPLSSPQTPTNAWQCLVHSYLDVQTECFLNQGFLEGNIFMCHAHLKNK